LWCCASVISCYRCWSICFCLLPSHGSASLLFKRIVSEFRCVFSCVQWFEYVLLARLCFTISDSTFFYSICAPVAALNPVTLICDGYHEIHVWNLKGLYILIRQSMVISMFILIPLIVFLEKSDAVFFPWWKDREKALSCPSSFFCLIYIW
jgi:hypothetical protein